MNTHSITETIRRFLTETLPNLPVHTPIRSGELATPYALLTCIADDEMILGNKTWECSLQVSLHSSAPDEEDTAMREQFTTLCSVLGKKTTREAINTSALDFILYSLSLRSIEEPQAMENDFIQSATFRLVVQF